MRYSLSCTPIVFLLFFHTSIAQAVEIGFSDYFERPLGPLADHPVDWTWTGDISPEIVLDSGSGDHWLKISTLEGQSGLLNLPVTAEDQRHLQYSFEAVLDPRSSDPIIDSAATCAFYLTDTGGIRLRDGTQWIEESIGLDASIRHTYTVILDFQSSTWSLQVDDLPVFSDLAMASPGGTSNSLRIYQENAGDSFLDNVSVALPEPDRITLDFLDDFERGPGAFDSYVNMWVVNVGPAGQIKNGIGASASKGLELVTGTGESAELNLYLPNHWQAGSWKQFEAILAPYLEGAEAPPVPSDAAVAFYLTESGDIRVRDGASWQLLDFEPGLNTATMHRYTVYQDYAAQTWKLWVNGTLATDPALSFANPTDVPSFIRISQAERRTAVFDNVAVSVGTPTGTLFGLKDFAAWQSGIEWAGADASTTGDPNVNGLANLLEYGFANDPITPHHYKVPIALAENGESAEFTFRRNRNAEDLAFIVQTSPDLTPESWTDLAPGSADVSVTPSIDPAIDIITVTLPTPDEQMFIRLKVVAP